MAEGRLMTRIVTTRYRYKRPPGRRKAIALEVPAVVTARRGKPRAEPAAAVAPLAANDERLPEGKKSALVTVRKPGKRFADVPDLTPEEHMRRGDVADALFHEIQRRIAQRRP
jgi:hypothetical protein